MSPIQKQPSSLFQDNRAVKEAGKDEGVQEVTDSINDGKQFSAVKKAAVGFQAYTRLEDVGLKILTSSTKSMVDAVA